MKFNLFLKDTHMKVIEKLKENHSGTSDQDIVKKYVKAAIQLNDDDLILDLQENSAEEVALLLKHTLKLKWMKMISIS